MDRLQRTTAWLLFLGCCLVGVAGAQSAPSVVINGNPLTFPDQPPVEQAGRIYVPMRAIFENLGATVVYSNGTINATRGPRTIQLTIGQPTATVSGQTVQLDSPPFEINGRALVPLRFVSQALGAYVNWDENRNTAFISLSGMGGGGPPPQAPPPGYQPNPSYGYHALLQQQYPVGTISQRYPQINVSFRQPVQPGSVRVMLDGQDVTSYARIYPHGLRFTPQVRLQPGPHRVRISGRTAQGQWVTDGWSFTIQ